MMFYTFSLLKVAFLASLVWKEDVNDETFSAIASPTPAASNRRIIFVDATTCDCMAYDDYTTSGNDVAGGNDAAGGDDMVEGDNAYGNDAAGDDGNMANGDNATGGKNAADGGDSIGGERRRHLW